MSSESTLRRLSQAALTAGLLGAAAVLSFPLWSGSIAGTPLASFFDKNWEELLIAVIGGAILGVLGGAMASFKRRRRVLTTSLCRRPDSNQRNAILRLYCSTFGDDENYDADEMAQILDGGPVFTEGCPLPMERVLVLAERGDDLRGFLLTFFYPTERKAIIGYVAVEPEGKSQEDQKITPELIAKLAEYLRDGGRCDHVFYEVANTSHSGDPKERNQQKYVIRRFRSCASKAGCMTYRLELPYRCPRVSLQDTARESDAMLLCISLVEPLPEHLPQDLVVSFLKFLYLDCYGDNYPMGTRAFREYRKYLEEFLAARTALLPEVIGVTT